MKFKHAAALAVTCLALQVQAQAGILQYGAFAGNNLSTGSNVNTVGSFWIGSNGTVSTLGGGTDAMNIAAGGAFSSGSNIEIGNAQNVANLIVNGNAGLGGGAHVFGSVHSGGNVTGGSNVQVNGNIYAAGSISLGGGSSVGGTLNPNTPGAPRQTFTAVDIPDSSVFAAGGVNQAGVGGGSLNLAPGTYGSLTTNSNANVFLSAGTYYFDSVNLGGGTDLHLDLTGGPISIFSVGNFITNSNVDFVLANGTAAGIYIETLAGVNLGGGTNAYGTFFAGNGDIVTNSNVDVIGALYAADEVNLGGGSTLKFLVGTNLPSQFNGSNAVPEPMSLAVWTLLGLTGITARRRRQS